MSNSTRVRLEKDVETAYQVQSAAAIKGGTRSTMIGIGLAIIGHYTWPWFRKQTLPFKAFIVSGFDAVTLTGFVLGAEHALLAHQAVKRQAENDIRREARLALARQGLVGTESEINAYREQKERMATANEAHPQTN